MWEQIRSNQIRSMILVTVMGLLLLFLGYFLGVYFFNSGIGGIVTALIVWAIMTLVGFLGGDSILLSVSGAKKISQQDHPRLYNVVEEMKVASGLEKMPDIYIIDDPTLNAFATGRDPNHAAVAITSGLLQKLNRDELQGVIGHEISHVKNRDAMLMALAAVLLGTIVMLAWYAQRFMFLGGMAGGRRRGSRDSGGGIAQLIIIVVGIILIILAPIMAQLIYFAISRKREYLADASSALYTRYPEGLASALEKLSASDVKVKTANQATAPMYIVNPFRRRGMSVSDLTSTHPSTAERIRILRSMAGGASFADYDQAYRQIRNTRQGLIPASALTGEAVSLRAAQPEAALQEPNKIERARETGDLMWRLSNYKTIDCQCGTKLRIPPHFRAPSIRCPHCGRINQIT